MTLHKVDFFEEHVVGMMDKLMDDFHVKVETAAAVFGNAGHESNGFRSLQEKKPLVKGSRGGYGIMQWTGPRRRLYEAYCDRNHLDPQAMGTNYAFLWVELHGDEGQHGKLMELVDHIPGLENKVEYFMKHFLRPGIPHLLGRIQWTKKALLAWNAAHKFS